MAPRWATWVGSLPMTATTVGVGSQELSEGGAVCVTVGTALGVYHVDNRGDETGSFGVA